MWPPFIIKLYLLFTKHTVHVIQYKVHCLPYARGYASGLLRDAASVYLVKYVICTVYDLSKETLNMG